MFSFQLRESIVVFSGVVKKYNKRNRERGKEKKSNKCNMNINLSCSRLLFFNKLSILESATLFSQERRTRSRKPLKSRRNHSQCYCTIYKARLLKMFYLCHYT